MDHDDWDDILFHHSVSGEQTPVQDGWDDDDDDDDDLLSGDVGSGSQPETSALISSEGQHRGTFIRRPGKGKGRGGGRPVGNRLLNNFLERNRTNPHEHEVPAAAPHPGTIEYARQCLAEKRSSAVKTQVQNAPGRAPVVLTTAAQNELAKHGPVQDLFLLSRDLQHDMLACAASAHKHHTPEVMDDPLLDHLETTPMTSMTLRKRWKAKPVKQK